MSATCAHRTLPRSNSVSLLAAFVSNAFEEHAITAFTRNTIRLSSMIEIGRLSSKSLSKAISSGSASLYITPVRYDYPPNNNKVISTTRNRQSVGSNIFLFLERTVECKNPILASLSTKRRIRKENNSEATHVLQFFRIGGARTGSSSSSSFSIILIDRAYVSRLYH